MVWLAINSIILARVMTRVVTPQTVVTCSCLDVVFARIFDCNSIVIICANSIVIICELNSDNLRELGPSVNWALPSLSHNIIIPNVLCEYLF